MLGAIVRDNQLQVMEIARPVPGAGQALVRAAASSINAGEVRGIRSAPHWQTSGTNRGWVPGWDFAGTVEQAAADGSGPSEGTRVVGWVKQGAWAEYIAAATGQIVALPDAVSFRDAATLPIAGLTAWHALRLGGLGPGKSVLVLGANGGVGRFALQIARAAGASTTAVVSAEGRRVSIADLADDVSVGLPAAGSFDIILECIGGQVLAGCFALVGDYGTIVSYGNASGEQTCFDAGPAWRKPCAALRGLSLHGELARRPSMSEGLGELVDLFAAGRLRTDIVLDIGLTDVLAGCDALTDRKVDGKAAIAIGAA